MRLPAVFFKYILGAVLILCFSAASAQDARYYYDQGQKFSEENNTDAAIKSYTTAISKNANYADAFAARGAAYVNKSQYDLAIRDFTKAISLDADNVELYISRGDAYLTDNQADLAFQDFKKAISLDANNVGAYASLGDYYSKKKEYDLSIQNYTKAINLNPEYTYPYIRRGYVYGEKKQYNLSIQDYTKAINLNAEADTYISRGDIYMENDQPDLALKDFTKALSLDADNAGAYASRGDYYNKKKQTDLAIKDYTKAIKLNPDYYYAYYKRGYVYGEDGEYDLAIQDFAKAISLDTDNPDAYISRGDVYSNNNHYDLAIQDFTKAINLDAGNTGAYNSRGYAYLVKYQYDLAIQDFTKAISLDADDAASYNNRGIYYNMLGKYELSVQDFKTCIQKDPKLSNTYINIISPLVRLLRFQEAKSYYDLYKQKKLSSHLESDGYKFYISFISAFTQISNGMLDEAMDNLRKAIVEYGTELKNETKRDFVDILFLTGYIAEKTNQHEDAKTIYEQSLAIDTYQPDINEALQRLDQKQTATRSIDKTGPEITLISPAPSRGFDIVADNTKTQIIGKAKDVAGIASIKINGVAVEKLEEDGLFITDQVLKSGANSLVITATDKQGNAASKTFTINGTTLATSNSTRSGPDQSVAPAAAKYYAILIAEKDYDDPSIPDLQNPVKDAKELKIILESKYTFSAANIDTLYNRSREDIMQAIVQRCNTLTENDNLVIFYAGHGIGEKDKFGDVDGYWIPTSARKDLNASYISADDINKAIKRSNAKHILIIADACFSGAFTRSLPADATKEITKQYAVSSRKVMASGNLEPVPDNSKFLFYLKKSLTENKEKYITAKDLFDGFYKAILSNSDNLPQYAAIKNVGDEGGEFIFIKK